MNDRVMKLLAAAAAVVDRWETPLWKDVPATAHYIYALRDAIEEAEKQEPVLSIERLDQWVDASLRKKLTQHTQPEWIGLTEEELLAIGRELGKSCRVGGNPNIDLDYARAIESKLKEKNT